MLQLKTLEEFLVDPGELRNKYHEVDLDDKLLEKHCDLEGNEIDKIIKLTKEVKSLQAKVNFRLP